jgi:hypothetical protein
MPFPVFLSRSRKVNHRQVVFVRCRIPYPWDGHSQAAKLVRLGAEGVVTRRAIDPSDRHRADHAVSRQRHRGRVPDGARVRIRDEHDLGAIETTLVPALRALDVQRFAQTCLGESLARFRAAYGGR